MESGRCSHSVCRFATLLMVLCVAKSHTTQKVMRFRQDIAFKDVTFSDKVSFENQAQSKLGCSVQCYDHDQCVSFTYVKNYVNTNGSAVGGRCLGLPSFVTSLAGSTPVAGARTYRKVLPNVAVNRAARQSDTWHDGAAGRAVDGNFSTAYGQGSCSHTQDVGPRWWQVDLAASYRVFSVALTNRREISFDRLRAVDVSLYGEDPAINGAALASPCLFYQGPVGPGATEDLPCGGAPVIGRYVRITATNLSSRALSLCEVQVKALPLN